MSSAQYDEDRQLSTGMGSELCLLSSKMQNTWPKKVYDTVHEYGAILDSIWTYQAISETTEHMNNAFHKIFPSFTYQATNAFHKIFPSFTYQATTPGPGQDSD